MKRKSHFDKVSKLADEGAALIHAKFDPVDPMPLKTFSENSLKKQFIRNYCNDHGLKIRWLRSIFLNENEKLETILQYLDKADSLIANERLRLIEDIKRMVKRKTGDAYYPAITDIVESLNKII